MDRQMYISTKIVVLHRNRRLLLSAWANNVVHEVCSFHLSAIKRERCLQLNNIDRFSWIWFSLNSVEEAIAYGCKRKNKIEFNLSDNEPNSSRWDDVIELMLRHANTCQHRYPIENGICFSFFAIENKEFFSISRVMLPSVKKDYVK